MSLNLKIWRSSAVLSLNEVVGFGCSFVRNYILARVLSRDDFGIAAMLTVTFLFLETTSKMAFGPQITSSKNGGDPQFVDTEHTVQLLFGVGSALVFLALAVPLAALLGVPQLAWGLQLLALVPACMAFGNLGAFTYTREMHFERVVSLEAVPQILITLAAWPVAVWFHDFRAFIWLQIGKAALSTLVSYVVGGRRYGLAFRKDYCQKILKFSWPLVISGLIMLCSNQGDRLVMVRGYSLADLGSYAVAWSLAATPSFALLKIIGSVALPLLSRVADQQEVLKAHYALVAQLFCLCGALFAVAMAVGGEEIITILFGSKYAGAGVVAAWLACAHAVRLARGAPTGVAWARGETRSQMLGNIVRLVGLLLVVPVVILKAPLYWVAVAGMVGELFALTAAVAAVRRIHHMEMWLCFRPLVVGAGCVGVAAAMTHWLMPQRSLAVTAVLLVLVPGLTVLVFSRLFPEIGKEVGKIWTAGAMRIFRPTVPSPD
jgi:O-antigen/teichoic acid export membrane protein